MLQQGCERVIVRKPLKTSHTRGWSAFFVADFHWHTVSTQKATVRPSVWHTENFFTEGDCGGARVFGQGTPSNALLKYKNS